MDSVILEVAIGLVTFFVIVSAIASAVNEIVTRMLNLRSKALWATFEGLLEERSDTSRETVGLNFLWNLVPGRGARPRLTSTPAATATNMEKLAATASFWSLDYVKDGQKSKLWQVPKEVFAAALLELARINGGADNDSVEKRVADLAEKYKDAPLGQYLHAVGGTVGKSVDTFTTTVGTWFDGQMTRLTASYRRLTKYTLFVFGLLIALVFNVDAIGILHSLATNAESRQAVVLVADDITAAGLVCAKEGEPQASPSPSEPTDNPTGPGGSADAQSPEELIACAAQKIGGISNVGIAAFGTPDWRDAWGGGFGGFGLNLLGLLVTALAASLGGPYWFDFLNFLTGVRRRE